MRRAARDRHQALLLEHAAMQAQNEAGREHGDAAHAHVWRQAARTAQDGLEAARTELSNSQASTQQHLEALTRAEERNRALEQAALRHRAEVAQHVDRHAVLETRIAELGRSLAAVQPEHAASQVERTEERAGAQRRLEELNDQLEESITTSTTANRNLALATAEAATLRAELGRPGLLLPLTAYETDRRKHLAHLRREIEQAKAKAQDDQRALRAKSEERAVAQLRVNQLTAAHQALDAQLQRAVAAEARLTLEDERARTALAAGNADVTRLQHKLQSLQQDLTRAKDAHALTGNQLQRAREEIQRLNAGLAQATADRTTAHGRVTELEAELALERRRVGQLQAAEASAKIAAQAAERSSTDLSARLAELRAVLDREISARRDGEKQLQKLSAQLGHIGAQAEHWKLMRQEAVDKTTELKTRIANLRHELGTAQLQHDQHEAAVAARETELHGRIDSLRVQLEQQSTRATVPAAPSAQTSPTTRAPTAPRHPRPPHTDDADAQALFGLGPMISGRGDDDQHWDLYADP